MQEEWIRRMVGPDGLLANRYHLQRPLGSGSFGQVFYAEDMKFKPPRPVAVKLLHPQYFSDVQVREDIRSEAGVLARFSHPYILRVIDFELSEEIAYIVTELAEGGSLARLIRPDPLQPPVRMPLETVAVYLDNIASALDEAHNIGLVHRDIKPHNILLDRVGRPMLADFGLAAALGSSTSSMLVTASSSGTPLYMAPEQWAGSVGKTTDIYALGVVIFQMITGQPPYQGNQASLAWQHHNAPIPKLGERAPGLVYPPALDDLMAAVLAKDPRQRLRPASEFARRFRAILSEAATGRPVSAPVAYQSQPSAVPTQGPQPAAATTPLQAPTTQPGNTTYPLNYGTQAYTAAQSFDPSRSQAPTIMPAQPAAPAGPGYPPAGPGYIPDYTPPARRKRSMLPWLVGGTALLAVAIGAMVFLLMSGGNRGSTTAGGVVPQAAASTPSAPAATTAATSAATSAAPGATATASLATAANPGATTAAGAGAAAVNTASLASNACSTGLPPVPTAPPIAASQSQAQGQLLVEVLETNCALAKGSDVFVRAYRQGDRNTVVGQDGGRNRLWLTLPAGVYEVEVSYDNGIKEFLPAIEVKAGQRVAQSLNLHVGKAHIDIFETDGKSAKEGDVFVRVYKQNDRNTLITQDGGRNKLDFVLRTGSYEMEVSYANGIKMNLPPVEIKEGQTANLTANLKVGHATIEIQEADGKSAKEGDVFVRVYKEGDHNSVVTQDGGRNKLSFTLRPGKYELEVSYANGIKVTGPAIEVKEGQTVNQVTNLKVGRLELTVSQADGKSAKEGDVFVRVYKQGDRNTVVTQDGGRSKLNFVLKPGVYELEVTYTNNVKVVGSPVEIKEGQTATQAIKV